MVQVKDNQGQLKKAIEQQFDEYFKKLKATPVIELKEKGHGRIEEQNAFQLKATFPPELSAKWPSIRSLIAVEPLRTIKGKTTIDTSFYMQLSLKTLSQL